MKARIIDIKHFAIHDGNGIRTTIFFKGCPLNCVWCHNPESISPKQDIWITYNSCIKCLKCLKCPNKAITINDKGLINIVKTKCNFCGYCTDICPSNSISRIDREITVDEIINEVQKDKVFYKTSAGGITLSGGEPFLQKDFVLPLLKELKAKGFTTCVETSMYTDIETLKEAVKFVDKFFVDIKILDNELHKKFTGVSNKKILENFKFLAENAKEIEVRIPLIPNITATENNLLKTAEFIKKINPNISIELLNYNSFGHSKYDKLNKACPCKNAKPFSHDELNRMKNIVKV
jgi:pyruvate formate lyase activating enzyme